MSNIYTPPGPLDFYNSNFSNNLIYYNYQTSVTNNYSTSSSSFSTITAYTPNSINVPIPGDYIIHVTTGAYSTTTGNRAFYNLLFSKAAQSNISISDNAIAIFFNGLSSNVAYNFSFSRKVTFPVSGVWTLTPQWKRESAGSIKVDTGDYYPWIVSLYAINPLNNVNTQFTKFLDANYTLMTNLDANAYWGTLTSSGVSSSLSTNTNGVLALTSQVNVLSSEVNNLSNTVSGLTSIAVTSGGIRIKP